MSKIALRIAAPEHGLLIAALALDIADEHICA